MEGPGTGLRPTMLKLGAAPITPSLFWLPVMVYAPGPGIVSHSYGRLPLSGGMLRHLHGRGWAASRAEDGVRTNRRHLLPGRVNGGICAQRLHAREA